MASYNRDFNNSIGSNVNNKGFFNKILKNLSSFGMNYSDMMDSTSYSIGAFEDPTQTETLGNINAPNLYEIFTKKVISKVLERKSVAYLDRGYEDKRKILQQYSIKDDIKRYITEVADEAIIYDDDNLFCNVKDLPEEIDETIRKKYHENFLRLYHSFGFNDGITAWNHFKTFLIDGYLGFEIVYDNKLKTIKELYQVDPMTVIPASDPETGTFIWIQYPDDPQRRRLLLDSQFIYMSYSNNAEYTETSYVENLIRPYNQLKMIEETKILYNINQAALYKKFIIPVDGLTKQQAEQQIYQLMAEYHEDVQWDESMGTVTINGSRNIPHSKDFWFPSSNNGNPDFEIVNPQGHDLNEDVMLNWFYRKLKRATHIPFGRFDEENGGGNIYNDSADITRDEISFGNYIKRLRTIYKEIIVKPLRNQMILDFPELENDNIFNTHISIEFNTNNLFEEWKYLNNLAKRSDIASTLSSNVQDAEGNPYLHVEWIVRNILKLTDSDIAENNKYKMMYNNVEGNEGEGNFKGGGSHNFGGERSDFGSEEFGGETQEGGSQVEEFGSETQEGGTQNEQPDFGGEEPTQEI